MISSGIPNFNSIKVRLELLSLVYEIVAPEFQFHKGAIRTSQEVIAKSFP